MVELVQFRAAVQFFQTINIIWKYLLTSSFPAGEQRENLALAVAQIKPNGKKNHVHPYK